MPTVLDWNPTVDPSAYVPQLREALTAGDVVVLPGDVGYVALVNPAAPTALAQLRALSEIAEGPPAVLAFGPDDAVRFGLDVPTVARRLMFRAWPAPLAVALSAKGAIFPGDWPENVRAAVVVDGLIRFRSPDHPAFDPLWPVLPGITLVAETLLPSAEAVVESLAGKAGFALSAGERPIGGRPSEILVDRDGWNLIPEGAFGADEIEKLAARIILFVCTGNTCRSPLAEVLAEKLLADRLGCGIDDLPARGFWVLSAGVSAYPGWPATPESEEAGAAFGVDLSTHRSRPLNPQLMAAADDVVVMTSGHAQVIASRYPGIGPGVRLLCEDGSDLDDPIGSGLDVYQECAHTILKHLERFIPEWVGS